MYQLCYESRYSRFNREAIALRAQVADIDRRIVVGEKQLASVDDNVEAAVCMNRCRN